MFHVKHEPFQELASFDLAPANEARLITFANLLVRWNTRINLISPADLKSRLWSRHIADSLQLISFLPSGLSSALDLGTGAGFPGLVLAIATGIPFSLIESDRRKAAFLVEAARLTAAPVRVYASRIEHVHLPPGRLVTARALAPLLELLALAVPFLAPEGVCLFPKGKNCADELTDAGARWHMRVERFPSRTDPQASILRISEIRRVRASP